MKTVCYNIETDRSRPCGGRVRSFAVILVELTESGWTESLLFVGSRRQCAAFRKAQV